jgi:hypothetical protein
MASRFYFELSMLDVSLIWLNSFPCTKKERKNTPTLRYRVLFGDSFETIIFFLQLLLAVALNRRPAWRRVPPLNHFSSPYTLTHYITSRKVRCMSHVISMPRPRDPKQTVVSEFFHGNSMSGSTCQTTSSLSYSGSFHVIQWKCFIL